MTQGKSRERRRQERTRTAGRGKAFVGPTLGMMGLVALVTFMTFRTVVHGELLLWDDNLHLTENPLLWPADQRDVLAFWKHPYGGLYIPVSYTVLAAECRLAEWMVGPETPWRARAWVFHAASLGMHIACSLLVLRILFRLGANAWAAVLGALLFAVHPVQVESVAWVSEWRGLTAALFSLVAIEQYVAAGKLRLPGTGDAVEASHAALRYAVAAVCFVAALLSKPSAATLPLMLALLEVGLGGWQGLRRAAIRLGPWLVLVAFIALLTHKLQSKIEFVPEWWLRPLLAGAALAFYGAQLVLPLWLCTDYGFNPKWLLDQPWIYAAWVLPAAGLAALAWLPHRRVPLTGAAFFVAGLLPVLGLVPFGFQDISLVADRYLYVPLVGVSLVVAWWFTLWGSVRRVAAGAVYVLVLAAISHTLAPTWRNGESLFRRVLDINPRSATAYNHVGIALEIRGDLAKAVNQFENALQWQPNMAEAHNGLATTLRRMGQLDEAMTHAVRAVELRPESAVIRMNLATLLIEHGQWETALEHLQRAVNDNPSNAQVHFNLARALAQQGETARARQHYERAVAIRPGFAEAHTNLGNLALRENRFDEAEALYRRALQVNPTYPDALNNLGLLLIAKQQLDEAEVLFTELRRLHPEDLRGMAGLDRIAQQRRGIGREASGAP